MNLPCKSRITALLASLCRNHGRISQVLSSQHCSQSFHVNCNDIVQDNSHDVKSNGIRLAGSTGKQTKNVLYCTSSLLSGKESLHCHRHAVSFVHTLCSGFQSHHDVLDKTSHGHNLRFIRHKSKKKRLNTDDHSDSDEDDNLDEDDFDAPAQFKGQRIHVASLRIDAILSTALGLSRHRLEEIFFGPGILLNGQKVLKKSAKMDVGDYVDAIIEKSDDEIKVKRVKLLKVDSEKTSTDKFIIKVRVWKAPFLIDNPYQWKPDS